MTTQEFHDMQKEQWEQEKKLLDKEFFELKEEHPEALFFSPYDMEKKEQEHKNECDILFNRWGTPH